MLSAMCKEICLVVLISLEPIYYIGLSLKIAVCKDELLNRRAIGTGGSTEERMKEESTVGGARKETKPKHNRLSLIMKCLVLYGAYHREQFFFASSPVHLNSGLSPNTFKQKLKTYLLPRIGKRHYDAARL